jgi:hypothetical protein
MKISRVSTALLFATLFVFSGNNKLHAVPVNPTFTFPETGQGKLELPNGFVVLLPGVLAPDPGPGGLSSALTFTAHPAEENLVVGDLFLLDGNGRVSDILRFNPGAAISGQPIVFYSNDSNGLLADTGLPAGFYANSLTILENPSGPTIYTPIAGQPGFEPASGALPVTYQIFSTPDDGSTLSLLAVAIFGIAFVRRKLCSSS